MIEAYLNYLLLHPVIAQFIIYGICVLTCLAGIGCIMPCIVLFTTLGTLIGLEKLPLVKTIVCAISGTATGSLLSFWLGYYYRASLRKTWLLRAYPQLLIQSEAFFTRFGEISIFIGRFLGPIRAILPLIAGMTGMRLQYFLIADITSAIVWPLTYIIPSIYLVHSLSDIIAALPIYQLIYALLGLVIAYFVLKWLRPYYEYPTLQAKQWILSTLINPIRDNRLLKLSCASLKKQMTYPLLSLLIISVILLSFLIFQVLTNGFITQWNLPIYHTINYLRSTLLTRVCVMISLFNAAVIYFFFFNIFIALLTQKQYWRALHWGGLGLLSLVMTQALKITMAIPRPLEANQLLAGYSFPSGHVTLNATLLGGFLLLLRLPKEPNKKLWQSLYSLYGIAILLLGFSRLYLYAHWLTDIIGALLVSIINLSLFYLSYRRYVLPLQARSQLSRVGLASLLIGWSIHFILSICRPLITKYIFLNF